MREITKLDLIVSAARRNPLMKLQPQVLELVLQRLDEEDKVDDELKGER